ncbi:MAG: ATP phosphoribosyltransferase regulatory subunit, partial [Lachnospirales bacterium]
MLITKLHTPEGVKDYLPEEYRYKLAVENSIAETFETYGYSPVLTPTIEYSEVFDNAGSIDGKRVYKFVDRDGTLLSLRPDFTPSIARIVATTGGNLPKKLYYIGNTFRRNESYQGKLREFTQAGIEIIDSSNPLAADAEAIVVAIKALIGVGIKDFKIDIGHAKFLTGVIDEANISEDVSELIKENILNKNYVAVSEIAESIKNPKIRQLLKDLPLLIGGFDILESVKNRIENDKAQEALNYLIKLYNILEKLGYKDYISFDLSVIGAMDYYTGIIFRGYARGTGSSVIDGGRYDNMVS